MAYVICNSNEQYFQFGENGAKVVSSYDEATKWSDITKANNVLRTMSSKYHPYNFSVQVAIRENGSTVPPAKAVNLEYDIEEKINEIKAFVKNLEERRLFLLSQIQILDLELVDIQHAAEFYNLNASQGYKLYRLMHDVTTKRRNFKDELKKIELSLGSSLTTSTIGNLEKAMAGLNNRQYTPRINKTLFNV